MRCDRAVVRVYSLAGYSFYQGPTGFWINAILKYDTVQRLTPPPRHSGVNTTIQGEIHRPSLPLPRDVRTLKPLFPTTDIRTRPLEPVVPPLRLSPIAGTAPCRQEPNINNKACR